MTENEQLLKEAKSKYNNNSPETLQQVHSLRKAEQADNQLAKSQKDLEKRSQNLDILIGQSKRNYQVYKNRGNQAQAEELARVINKRESKLRNFNHKLQEIKQVRATLLALYPASGVLKSKDVKESSSDIEVIKRLTSGFESIQSDIEKTQAGIISGDVPITKLGSLVTQTLNEIPDESARQSVEKYLAREQKKETIISLSTLALEIGLTIAALCTGGIAGIIVAGLGTALGIGTAVYEFEQIDDLNTAAKTGQAGGNQLLSEPNQVKQDYIFAWVNLVLAGVDGVLAIREGGKLLDGLKAAEKLATYQGGEVLYRLPREELIKLQKAVDLEKAGDAGAKQVLEALREELGEDFDAAYDLFKDSEIRIVDDVETATVTGRSRELDQIESLKKLRAKYENAVFEADGQAVKVNNQIKIHPNKLDELEDETLDKIVESTKELENVGGDMTKVTPQTRKNIEDLTSTKGGRWRFEYQKNDVVNQYLEYVGIKDDELFQNMSDAEKARLFDISNQMDYLDDVPANAKKRQRKLDAKAQEKMIEQQAASYAIQQNPKNASEFVNHTEFYKTQMKQKIVDLEKQYDRELEAAVNEIATREGIEPNRNKFTNKQREEANKKASQAFFGELYSEELAFKNEKAAKKYFKDTTYKSVGYGNNFEQLRSQTKNEIQNNYEVKVAEIADNIGEFKIEPNLSSDETNKKKPANYRDRCRA